MGEPVGVGVPLSVALEESLEVPVGEEEADVAKEGKGGAEVPERVDDAEGVPDRVTEGVSELKGVPRSVTDTVCDGVGVGEGVAELVAKGETAGESDTESGEVCV